MKLKNQMNTVEYLEARLWDAIQEIDKNRDAYTDAQLRLAFQSMTKLSTHIKQRIVKDI
jgi:hypothetical protein